MGGRGGPDVPFIFFKPACRVDIDVINYATKNATDMKVKFSYCDQNLMRLY